MKSKHFLNNFCTVKLCPVCVERLDKVDRDSLVLAVVLGVLCLGILGIGMDLLASALRGKSHPALADDALRHFLRAAPPMPDTEQDAAKLDDKLRNAELFTFRRQTSREFAAMQPNPKRFRPAKEALGDGPTPVDFAVIRKEVRAALGDGAG